MARGGRRVPRYAREAAVRDREAAEARKLVDDAFLRWVDTTGATAERERRDTRRKHWATVDPAARLRRVHPFDHSRPHGITREVLSRFKEIKLATLGYLECTVVTPDEGRCHLSGGPLGCVASQQDAERLLSALAAEFPHVPFRVELDEVLLENVIWRSVEDVLRTAGNAESGRGE